MVRPSSSFLILVALAGCGRSRSAPAGESASPDAAPALDGGLAADAATAEGTPDAAIDGADDLTPSGVDGRSPPPDGAASPDAGADAPRGGPYLVETLEGDVTGREVTAFITAASAAAIPTAHWTMDNVASHNTLSSFGRGGITLEAINRMYEVARALRMAAEQRLLLDLAIKWTDGWLVHRNDLPLGEHRVMWTGKVEPLWPPNHPADPEAAYAGSETGDTVGIAAYTALNIAATPELAAVVVGDGDPNHLGATYLARARTYVSMLEVCMDQYFIPSFLDPTTLTLRHPASPAYAIPGTPGGSQNVNAWNRMMLFMHGFQTLGQAHHLLGDSPSKDAMYRKVVENTVNAFVRTPLSHAAADGTPVYDWGYGNFGDILNNRSNEDISHGQIDMLGLTRAYRGGYTDATAAQMKTFADTVVHELLISPGVYAGSVNRAKAKEMAPALPGGWLLLSPYNPEVYRALARDMMASGRQARDAGVTAYILWAKHWTAGGPFPAN
jgi:hypothetical protein